MKYLRFCYVFPLLALLSFVLHAHIFQRDLVGIHVWRQTETATVVRTMARGDGDLLHPKVLDLARPDRVFRMEVPLMQAAFAAVCRITPIQDYVVMRGLTFLMGLLTVAGMYTLGHTLSGIRAVGVLTAWTFNWSPVFYYYTLNPLPDNAALCCAVWSLAALMAYRKSSKSVWLVTGAILAGLAAAIKLPYVVFSLAAFPIWLQATRTAHADRWRIPLLFVAAMIPAASWYVNVMPRWEGNGVVGGIVAADTSVQEIASILTGHLFSTGPELLVNYGSLPALIAGLMFAFANWRRIRTVVAPIALVAAGVLLYYLYELPLIGLVHDYYLMPFLPLLFLLIGAGNWRMLQSQKKPLRILAVLGLAVLPLTAFLRIDTRWQTAEPGFNPAYLTHKAALRKLIPPASRVVVGPDDSRRILLYHLDLTGWTFTSAGLQPDSVEAWVQRGARFLLTDPATAAGLQPVVAGQAPIFSTETLVVYALQ